MMRPVGDFSWVTSVSFTDLTLKETRFTALTLLVE